MHLLHLNSSLPIKQQVTILLVESNPEETDLLQSALAKTDLDVSLQVVSNGLEAVYYLAGKEPYDNLKDYPLPVLVITPLSMRKFSGLDLFNWIKHQPQLQHLPVILKVALDEQNSVPNTSIARLSSLPYLSGSLSCEALVDVIQCILNQEAASHSVDTIMAS